MADRAGRRRLKMLNLSFNSSASLIVSVEFAGIVTAQPQTKTAPGDPGAVWIGEACDDY